jgi:hypothetical protein
VPFIAIVSFHNQPAGKKLWFPFFPKVAKLSCGAGGVRIPNCSHYFADISSVEEDYSVVLSAKEIGLWTPRPLALYGLE